MSDGKEVRRYWPRVNDSGAVFMDEVFDGGYVEFTYHDREMAKDSQLQREAYDAIRERDKQIAELRAEVEALKTTVENNRLDHEWPIVKQLADAETTIARQAREAEVSKAVIEKLKEAHRKNADEDFRGNRTSESVRSFRILEELTAIERAEGEKE